MLSNKTIIKVRYAETDQMGFVYYGNYAIYYEVARVELFQKYGVNYDELEKQGYFLPVIELNIKYRKPAVYHQEIVIEVEIRDKPGVFIDLFYTTKCLKENYLLNKGYTRLAFMGKDKKLSKAPDWLAQLYDKLNN